ncbi:putative L-arabinokinase [Helianthus annuus]|uniref:L-arabinokinase n=1 Tax=Helianthus annuus TaxID=4232 RepID=A0A251RLN7_HELAN|nr:L-arabinokinase [Helianthus annuus]KAF5754009.1 putative L-arabinokinase [Helianthus annuus]KAJ0431961.1 putative L-arabinokinase [Helianthus annuus]
MRIDDGVEQVSASRNHLVFAYYVTGHGFGHATRVVEVVRHLILAGHDVHVVTGAPDFVFTTEIQSPRLFLRKLVLDCGAVQADALTVDRLASLEKYSETAVAPRASILATEVKWLNSIKADLVVSDVVAVACRAAADAGIRSVCVTNFSWDFIYAEYVMAAGYHHRSIVWQIAEDYSHCEFLIRLPGYTPMPAFRDVIDVPLVVRRLHKSRKEVRSEMGISEDVKLVILNFGGQPAGWKLKEEYLPPGWLCLVCGASEQELPPNFIKLPKDVYTPDVMAASDCMLGKIGYGTVSEALAYKLPFVFVRRDYFNEEPFLRNMLEFYQGGVEMIRRDLLTGHWIPYLERATSLKPSYDGGVNGGQVAARILQDTANGKNYASDKLSGARRLRDAIVLGYQLQRVPGRDISIPEWYASAENEFGLRTGSHSVDNSNSSVLENSDAVEFDILHGDVMGLPDTMSFLRSLAELDVAYDSEKFTEKHHVRERKAAANLFNWEEDIYVARAPGRLDVIGGIADYSGSLVLQMPIREACHVAVQKIEPSKQRLWKHAQARQQAKGQSPTPVLQIVSYGSELSNRGPTFDMDISDFMDGDQPMSYEKARSYFARDPSQKWAAYVAGTILVLMKELNIRFESSISMLVSSAVPEGKGVSSSASVEVASMSAIAAAHGLNISPRELALLCQKVENSVVGAPCGVMDQMASACGEANKLLAMVCQPAEVLGLVDIPSHIRFWGIDSGLRHSIGGADYGSVRIGAFMGRKMIKSTASAMSSSYSNGNGNNLDELEEYGIELLHDEASVDYLCNLTPHRFEAIYSKNLPDTMTGEAFLTKYDHHNDPVTVIDKKRSYGVKAATRHPIYENFRVKAFKALLTSASSEEQLTALGEIMYQCHYSYSDCGLGSDGTDRLVQLVQEMQHRKASVSGDGTLYGAKITGGGSGGTISVIGRNCLRSSEQILQIQQRYKNATGYMPFLFEGSSPGAGKFGHLRIRRRVAPMQD